MYVTLVKDVKNVGVIKYMESEHGLKTMVGVGCPTMLLFIACLFMFIESSSLYRNVQRSRELVDYYNRTTRRSRTPREIVDYYSRSIRRSRTRRELASDETTKKEDLQKEQYEKSAEMYYLQLDKNTIKMTSKINLMEAPYPWSKGEESNDNI